MSAVDTINLKIDDKAHSYAKIYASLLSSEFQRKRAYASITALFSLINLLEETELDIHKSMTLFRNPVLNEQYEISDLYVNGWHIDVRVITGGSAFLVPKTHYDNDITPDFYAVIKVDNGLKSAELLGFANAKSMSKEGFNYNYYSSPVSELMGYKEFLTAVSLKKVVNFSPEEHEFFKEQYLSLVDDEIDNATKNRLLKHMFECNECRTEFCCFTGFEMVSCHVGEYPDLLTDQTLNIIGAQEVDNPKYEGKEEVISIVDDEPVEDNVSDILDELFNIDEETFVSEEENTVVEKEETVKYEDKLDDITLETEEMDSSSIIEDLPEPLEVSEDLQIFDEENTKDDFEHIKDEKLDSHMLLDEQPYPHKDLQDDDLLEIQDTAENELLLMDDAESDLVEIKEDDNSFLDTTDDIFPSEPKTEEVQKVIVDYDEEGEPLYSYITNVSSTDEPTDTISEIVSIDEKIDDSDDWEKEFEKEQTDLQEIENNDSMEASANIIADENDESYDEVEEFAFEENENVIEETADDDLFAGESPYEEDENDDNLSEEASSQEEQKEETEFFDEEVQEETEEFEFNDGIDQDSEYEDEEYAEYEDEDDESQSKKSGSKKGLLIAFFTFVLLAAGGAAFFFAKNISASNNSVATENTETQSEMAATDDLFEQPIDVPPVESVVTDEIVQETEQTKEEVNEVIPAELPAATPSEEISIEVPQAQTPVPESVQTPSAPVAVKKAPTAPIGDVNKVMSNVFATQSNVSLRGVNWQCAPTLFTNKDFKAYLQGIDDVLKLNMKKNLLDATEVAQNPSVTVKMAIDNNGQMIKSLISESSGSEQIDNIVLQSINQTLESQKTQILTGGEQKADKYFLQVVIKL